MSIWFTFLYQPLLNLLMFLYQALGNNLGLAIIGATILIRVVMVGLTMPGMKSAQKMQDIKPQLDALKEKHKEDKQALAQAQMALYREHGINPISSIIPMIAQIIVIIALYQAFGNALKANGDAIRQLNEQLYPFVQLPAGSSINTNFLYLDLLKPDRVPGFEVVPGIFLIASAAIQFVSTRMMLPKTTSAANSNDDIAVAMQKQMMFLGPIMTLFIGYTFQSGLVLAWFMLSLLMAIQQLYVQKLVKKPTLSKTGSA